MIEKDLYEALKNVCPRVYPIKMPQDTKYPVITYQVVYDGTAQSIKGDACGRDTRLQVDVWSESYSEAKELKSLVVDEVISLGGGSISAQDLYEDEIKLYRQLIDFKIRK